MNDPIEVAKAMREEYIGQADRELAPTVQFALNAKANAMDEFLIRLNYLENGEKQA